jgi:hypothetical protein
MKRLLVPPLLTDIVQSGLLACEGIVFGNRETCPVCGGGLSGYDTKQKQFAVLHDGDYLRTVHVSVRRFSCKECHAVCFADEPFYPGTRHGSPVVELCITLSEGMPFHRAAAYMTHMGVSIDRGTVRNYAQRIFPEIPTTDLFGIHLPLSIVSLSELAGGTGEGSSIKGAEALAACGFPSAYRTPPNSLRLSEQGNKRDEQKHKEERQPKRP